MGTNWQAQRFRDATGYGALAGGSTGRATASYPWLRFRRASSTTFALEAAPDSSGSPGTWVSIGTADASADSLALNMAATQLDLMALDYDGGYAGSSVFDQVGLAAPVVSVCALRRRRMA